MARKKKVKGDAAVGFEGAGRSAARQRLTPNDIQQRVFRLAFRGYHEHDVDEFLDQVTEDLAALYQENKRLREQLQEAGGTSLADIEAAGDRAEQIVREAREHAARLVAEAERRSAEMEESVAAAAASGAGAAEPPKPPNWYLLRERAFLERLASLVRDHAEDLKREARQQPAQPAAPEAPATPVAQPAPEAPREAPPAAEAEEESMPEAGTDQPAPRLEEEDVIRLEDEPVARPEREVQPATAPMSSVDVDEEDLLSEWESSFAREERGGTEDGGERDRREDDSSLKELFWGEE